jgi:Fe-S-cluster containining protein
MASTSWNAELFSSELTSSLVAMLAGARSAGSLRRAVAESADAAEAACGERSVACGAGCPYCCVLTVAILLPEAMIIAEWLQRQSPQGNPAAVRERLAAHRRRSRWMDDEARIFAHVTCPLLDGAGSCTIHPVRPLVCRGAASFDSGSCREALRPMDPDPEERVVAVDLLRQTAFDTAFMALAQALRHHGLDDHSIELGAGVLAFLDRPDYLNQLLNGEQLPRELWETW